MAENGQAGERHEPADRKDPDREPAPADALQVVAPEQFGQRRRDQRKAESRAEKVQNMP
jgi:hypothetical protein